MTLVLFDVPVAFSLQLTVTSLEILPNGVSLLIAARIHNLNLVWLGNFEIINLTIESVTITSTFTPETGT